MDEGRDDVLETAMRQTVLRQDRGQQSCQSVARHSGQMKTDVLRLSPTPPSVSPALPQRASLSALFLQSGIDCVSSMLAISIFSLEGGGDKGIESRLHSLRVRG